MRKCTSPYRPYKGDGPTEAGVYFPQAILAEAAPVMEESASQLNAVMVTSALVQRDFMEKIAKKVNTVNCQLSATAPRRL